MSIRRRGNYVVGLFLFALGAWILAGSLGVPLPGMGQIWPALLIIFGLAMLVQSSGGARSDRGLVFAGTVLLLGGIFLMPFTLDALLWRDMRVYWPVFPLILGIAFFALYLAGGMQDTALLAPSFAVGGVGLLALPFTLGAVQNPLLVRLARFWPVLILVLGLAFAVRPARRRATPKGKRKKAAPGKSPE